jgi:porin
MFTLPATPKAKAGQAQAPGPVTTNARAPQPRALRNLGALACLALSSLGIDTAMAAPPQVQLPTAEQLQSSTAADGSTDFMQSLQRSGFLLGNMGGLRPYLSEHGMSLGVQETSEILLQMDTARAFGHYGGTFNISGLQIHGQNLSASNLYSLQTASGIEADPTTRLWELWYDQKFLDEDRLDVKIGQQSMDQEFMVSQNALLFVNTMFGWPMVPSADLPGGGPAYPLSALGLRVRGRPNDSVTLLGGVFNGSPVRNNVGDSQQENYHGTSFPMNGGVLAIAELQYAYPALGSMISADQAEPLARLYKIGFWYNSENFNDLRYDTNSVSLASPSSNGDPQQHKGNFSIYGVADQMIWQDPEEADRNVNFFIRAMGTPESDRNLINFSLNVGLTFHEPFLHRDDDTFGIGVGYAKVGSRAAGLDSDTAFYTGTYVPTRTDETIVEATYSYAAAPWLQIQPDVQYTFNPGGGLANPNGPGKIRDELVIGVRANIQF